LVFFYNILGALQECKGNPGVRDLIQLGTTLSYIDEYPDIVPGPFWFKRLFVRTSLSAVYYVGQALGYKPWIKEYTPEHLWEVARAGGLHTP
jgi:hypothetical protein